MSSEKSSKQPQQVDTLQIAIRTIVMFFGLSMVILGSHDIRRQHGSVKGFINKESQPIVEKIDKHLPNVEWGKMSKLFTWSRAKDTWDIKAQKIVPKK